MELTQNACLCKYATQHAEVWISKYFSGNIGEQALKGIVKDHVEKAQKQPDKFSEQCAVREYELNVIKYVMTDILS